MNSIAFSFNCIASGGESNPERFKERFDVIGDEPAGGTPEEFGAVIKRELAKWRNVVQGSGVKFD